MVSPIRRLKVRKNCSRMGLRPIS